MNDATHRRKRLVVKIGSATLTTSCLLYTSDAADE